MIITSSILQAQSLGLKDIIQQPAKDFTAYVKADQYGGSISFDRPYRTNCTGIYDITWSFDKDLSTLQNGEEFTITLSCKNCVTPCGYKWGIANVYAANNVLSIPGYSNYSNNGNIKQVSTTAGSSGVYDWAPGHLTHRYTFKYEKLKNTKMTSFTFDFAKHRVYYVFEEGASRSGATNCHALFGLGKLVSALEFGAYEGYGWDWMDKTIGYAIEHANASGCISKSYLLDLQKRMYRSSNTASFYDEISAYSRRLDSETASCNCCSR